MPAAPRGSQSGTVHACPDCDKTFSRKEYMARHHRSKHSKETPFSCEYCSRAFSRSDLLRRHYKTCAQAKGSSSAQDARDSASPNEPVASGSGQPALAERGSLALGYAASLATSSASPYDGSEFSLPVPPATFGQSNGPSPPGFDTSPTDSQPSPLYNLSPYSLPTNGSTSTLATSNGSPDFAAGQKNLYSAASTPPLGLPAPNPVLPPLSSLHPQSNNAMAPLSHAAYAAPHYAQHVSAPHLPAPAGFAHQYGQYGQAVIQQPQAQHRSESLPESQSQLQTSVPTSTADPPQNQVVAPAPVQPTSAFKFGSFSQDTLAPGLSGTGSFTKDEVLASEVLRDLMRSPLGPQHVTPMASPLGETPWHGAKAASRIQSAGQREGASSDEGMRGNEAVALVDGQDWTVTGYGAAGIPSMQVSNKLETSPAAQALASYFNQGGVGGITALDLGFATEPSLFPDFLFQPQIVHEEDKRYWLPEQKFCLGYLYPWHVPPLQVLSGYARKATEKLLPSMPIIHAPSVNLNEMATHTAFALTVAGGAYEQDGQSFSNEMLVEKRVFLVRGFQDNSKTFDEKFSAMQSLLLYQLLGLFHRDEQQRLLSHSFHSALIFMLQSLDLPAKIKSMNVSAPRPDLEGEELERAWKEWIKVETWRRVNFIVFLADLEYASATKSAQLLSLSDMDLDLPSVDRAWNAKSAAEWLEHMLSPFAPPAQSYLATLRALMSRSEPARDPFSEQAVLLAELSRISSFPLLILSRTLSFLEKKTEEAIDQMDPFKKYFDGTNVVDSRDAENRDVLSRIRSGRQYLRRLPGGLARGGGERWFEEIIPSAAGYKCSHPCSPKTERPPAVAPPNPQGDMSTDTEQQTLEEMFAEFDPQPYRPFYGQGGAKQDETYDDAQARMHLLTQSKLQSVRDNYPQFLQQQ